MGSAAVSYEARSHPVAGTKRRNRGCFISRPFETNSLRRHLSNHDLGSFRVKPWCRFVEVHFADGVEAYVTPVGPVRVGVAFLWDDARVARHVASIDHSIQEEEYAFIENF